MPVRASLCDPCKHKNACRQFSCLQAKLSKKTELGVQHAPFRSYWSRKTTCQFKTTNGQITCVWSSRAVPCLCPFFLCPCPRFMRLILLPPIIQSRGHFEPVNHLWTNLFPECIMNFNSFQRRDTKTKQKSAPLLCNVIVVFLHGYLPRLRLGCPLNHRKYQVLAWSLHLTNLPFTMNCACDAFMAGVVLVAIIENTVWFWGEVRATSTDDFHPPLNVNPWLALLSFRNK